MTERPVLLKTAKAQCKLKDESSEELSSSSDARTKKTKVRTFNVKGSPLKKTKRVSDSEASDTSTGSQEGGDLTTFKQLYSLVEAKATIANTSNTESPFKRIARRLPRVTITNDEVFEGLWQQNSHVICTSKELFTSQLTIYRDLAAFYCNEFDLRQLTAPMYNPQTMASFVNFVECPSNFDKQKLLQFVSAQSLQLIGKSHLKV